MVSIPKQVQEFLPGKLAWVATASRDGMPNVTPKGTLKSLDEPHVFFADLFSLKTRKNLEENKKVAVTVVDAAAGKGYQIKGTAEVLDSGPLFEETANQLKSSPKQLPPMQHLVKIAVESGLRSVCWRRNRQADRLKVAISGLRGRRAGPRWPAQMRVLVSRDRKTKIRALPANNVLLRRKCFSL